MSNVKARVSRLEGATNPDPPVWLWRDERNSVEVDRKAAEYERQGRRVFVVRWQTSAEDC